MTGPRWFATGPALAAPSAPSDLDGARERARARAAVYGSAHVCRVVDGRVVVVETVDRTGRAA